MASGRLIQVVEVVSLRGAGKEGSPYRNVTQYFSPDGELLAEKDPCSGDDQQVVTP
jgi:hypothetical protein